MEGDGNLTPELDDECSLKCRRGVEEGQQGSPKDLVSKRVWTKSI